MMYKSKPSMLKDEEKLLMQIAIQEQDAMRNLKKLPPNTPLYK